MSDESNKALIKSGKTYHPKAFGWLRRPEMDAPGGGLVYECPDGTLYVFPKGMPDHLLRIGRIKP
jgi:hypothetical protein